MNLPCAADTVNWFHDNPDKLMQISFLTEFPESCEIAS